MYALDFQLTHREQEVLNLVAEFQRLIQSVPLAQDVCVNNKGLLTVSHGGMPITEGEGGSTKGSYLSRKVIPLQFFD